MPCIIYIGNSQYNFTIKCGNFVEVCDAEGFPMAPAQMTAKEAVAVFVEENAPYMGVAMDFFAVNAEHFEIMKSEELSESLNGNFFMISLDTFAPYLTINHYGEGVKTQIAYLKYNVYGRSFEATEFTHSYTIENDLLTVMDPYQVRRLSEDIYVTYEQDDGGNYVIPAHLMIRYEESVTGSMSVYDEMLPHILLTMIPEIQENVNDYIQW